jgi:carboxylesterase type B
MNPWGAAIDGRVLRDIPTRLVEAGHFADVPVLAGTNQDEGVLFVLGVPSITRLRSAAVARLARDCRHALFRLARHRAQNDRHV